MPYGIMGAAFETARKAGTATVCATFGVTFGVNVHDVSTYWRRPSARWSSECRVFLHQAQRSEDALSSC